MSDETRTNRFQELPERPDPATWRSGRDESPLPQAIAEPSSAEDAALRWVAPELEAARRISDAVVRRRGSRD
ncbi:hypothetical protein GCM10010149_51260 [Nonomuraea roseoviolacea subsp. roseoviolacea]|uniref:Uncharacterized protein n=1 Tax=Nonomuraea roseoviolacea subsp. carminata TaxID=160689 RepID=A0ABT1K0M4_9ACTN|nr:hypothetical protein [Nonomuraea roseoviolacea]MCP2347551.1 hypothetical protein [Nonomuraea roseoviolacea subsp. carminata]